MSIQPIRSSSKIPVIRDVAKPRSPQGIAAAPDRISPAIPQEGPPSLFKMYLFQPIIEAVRFFLRGIFRFIDFLRRASFDEQPPQPQIGREELIRRFRSMPKPEEILVLFKEAYSTDDQTRVYQAIGEAYEGRITWKEMFWARNDAQNVELGRSLAQSNPFLLRDYLL